MDLKDFLLIIPCFNNREGLLKTLNSIDYPPQRFVVVIVDDGSPEPLVLEDIRELVPVGFNLELIRSSLAGFEVVPVPEDALITQADREGRSPMDVDAHSPAVEAIRGLAFRLGAWAERSGATELLPLVE